ncbi:hypothetical protein EV401DRAFT_1584021 [Pisolithus croceorrhizus]|nr:hypothetical protein EV401DRAFT_1584021 [Pisolithus croceorrhizus]
MHAGSVSQRAGTPEVEGRRIDDTELLQAWHSIISSPRFKDVDFNELCDEFLGQARCDGSRYLLEPEGIRHITEKFELETLEPGLLSVFAGPPVDDVSMQQQSHNFSNSPFCTAETPSTTVATSSMSMNEMNGVNTFDAFKFGKFGPPSLLNQTWVPSSGRMHAPMNMNQQFVSSNQGLGGFSMFTVNGVSPGNKSGQDSCELSELWTILEDLL